MKHQDLEQFLIDHQPEGSIVEVDAQWLQAVLKGFAAISSSLSQLEATMVRKQRQIDNLTTAIEVYKHRDMFRTRLKI